MNLTTSISSSRHPFHYAPFRNLFFARLLTVLGNGIAPIALAFAVLDIGGSATDLGLVVAARSIFNVAFLLIGGVLADRYSRSIVLLSSSTIAALSQGVVAWLVLDGSATIMGLAVLGTINGAAAGIALPASSAMVPQTVPAHSLRAANAFIQVGVYAGTIIGASLGGILTSTIGPGWGLAVDALGFAAAAPLYFFIRVNSTQSLESNTNILQDLRDGWKEFIARWGRLRKRKIKHAKPLLTQMFDCSWHFHHGNCNCPTLAKCRTPLQIESQNTSRANQPSAVLTATARTHAFPPVEYGPPAAC